MSSWNLNRRNDVGDNAIFGAVFMGPNRLDLVKLLLQHGIDFDTTNYMGLTVHPKSFSSLSASSLTPTASDLKFPMYLVPLSQLQQMYGGKEARHQRVEACQDLMRRGELVNWTDLPFDARIIFVSHEWVGWSHPDPHGVQIRTFLRVMQRLRSGDIAKVEMNMFHTLMYGSNHVVRAEEWEEILESAYVVFEREAREF